MYQTISICLAVLVFSAMLFTMAFTSILREGEGKSYSFHRFQLCIWTLIILPCFTLNWGFVNWTAPTLGATELVLLGISSATTLIAEIVTNVNIKSNSTAMLKSLRTDSKGFWFDLLSDDSGELSIARLQQLMFTFTYVIIYISMFIPKKLYPVFDANAFVLMGISAGTYLIGKALKK